MIGDPYEKANQLRMDEAKLVTPVPLPKNRKIVFAGMILAGLVLGLVILANVAGLVSGHVSPEARAVPKPTTLTKQQSDSFARQQSDQAEYIKGTDRNRRQQSAEDTVMGQGSDLAGDAYAEADGVPKRTKAQEEAEHGVNRPGDSGKSEGEQRRERADLEAQHRRENDLDSSAVSLDFSEYFAKEKDVPAALPIASQRRALASVEGAGKKTTPSAEFSADDEGEAVEGVFLKNKGAHDPKDDFEFDSSFGKLHRLMEDTILETVLVNRLTGASVGPVITMVTTDVYSGNGTHLLIPKGTRLLGRISAIGSVNQERLFVAFHRMIMPDGYSVSLDKFQGLDVVGQTGLRDLVNHHYVQIFGASLALAAVAATAQIGNNTNLTNLDWGSEMRNSASAGLGQSAQRVLERFMNVLPTFTIRERARVKVMLTGDLLLPDSKNHTMDPDL